MVDISKGLGYAATLIGTAGAVGALEAQFMLPNQTVKIPLWGPVDSRIGLAIHSALASFVGNVTTMAALPVIEGGSWQQYEDAYKMIAPPIFAGGAEVLLLQLSGDSLPTGKAFLIGASSNLIGNWVAKAYVGI
jgi:hypothetical protein